MIESIAELKLSYLIYVWKKIISILKNACFSGKGRQWLHIHVMRICISYVKLDHTLYSINYGTMLTFLSGRWGWWMFQISASQSSWWHQTHAVSQLHHWSHDHHMTPVYKEKKNSIDEYGKKFIIYSPKNYCELISLQMSQFQRLCHVPTKVTIQY